MNEVEELLQKLNMHYSSIKEGAKLEDGTYFTDVLDSLTCSDGRGNVYTKNILDFAEILAEDAYDYSYLEESEDEDDAILLEEAAALDDLIECLKNLSEAEGKIINWSVIYKYSNAANDEPIPSRGRKHVLDYNERAKQAMRLLPLGKYLNISVELDKQIDAQLETANNDSLVKFKENTKAIMPTIKKLLEKVTTYLGYFT